MSWLTNIIPGVSQAKAIIGGVMVLGLVGLALWVVRVDHLRAKHLADLNLATAKLAAESNAHRVTIASLGQCNTQLAAKSAESDRRAKALADATAGYQADLASLKKQSAGAADKIAYWQGMADKYQAEGKCPISADLAKELNR